MFLAAQDIPNNFVELDGNSVVNGTACTSPNTPPACADDWNLLNGAGGPNPTGSGTELTYSLPREAQVSAKVFDVAGRVVRSFGAGPVAAGWHVLAWDLADDAGQRVGPGLYFVRLSVDGRTQMRHVTVLR